MFGTYGTENHILALATSAVLDEDEGEEFESRDHAIVAGPDAVTSALQLQNVQLDQECRFGFFGGFAA